jgi:hypothetical protein
MNNRISTWFEETPESQNERQEEVHRMDEILNELLARYERQFPGIKIAVMETPVATF